MSSVNKRRIIIHLGLTRSSTDPQSFKIIIAIESGDFTKAVNCDNCAEENNLGNIQRLMWAPKGRLVNSNVRWRTTPNSAKFTPFPKFPQLDWFLV